MELIQWKSLRYRMGERCLRLAFRLLGWNPNECVSLALVGRLPSEVGMWAAALLVNAPMPPSVGIRVPPDADEVFRRELARLTKERAP